MSRRRRPRTLPRNNDLFFFGIGVVAPGSNRLVRDSRGDLVELGTRASATSCSRAVGSLCRQRRSRRRIPGATEPGNDHHFGLLLNDRDQCIGDGLAAERAFAREHFKHDTSKAQTSVRLSTAWPRACSGLM